MHSPRCRMPRTPVPLLSLGCLESDGSRLPPRGRRRAAPLWMRALIDHVERRPVGVSRRSRRCFAIPVIHEALRCSDAFEHGIRGSVDMTADDECPLAAVRVGDAHYEQSRTDVCGVPDVVMLQRERAVGDLEPDERRHLIRAATRGRLPCPTTGYVLWVTGIRAICARSRERDLRAIVGARRGHPAGWEGE